MHVHILGICGTLMGSIALLAKQLGHRVSGSDENVYPPMSTQLEAAGIALSSGYLPENIPRDVDLVIIGNANLPRGNPAVEYVLDRSIPYTSGAEWLGRYLLHDRWVIAVAGTHGKTTTTSMVAWILEHAGMAPGYLIGGVPGNFPESARLGDTDFFVIEADEYDTSYFDRRSKFLHYHPRTAILGNLEFDHADIFPDLDAIKTQFHLLMRTIPASGLVIRPAADTNIADVLDRGCWTPQISFGIGEGQISAHLVKTDASEFTVSIDGSDIGTVKWSLSGVHNAMNALAAIAACRHVGVAPAISCEALERFKGVKRRMEKIYTSSALCVYDDFAHHPTAIQTTLEGLRQQVGNERILAIIEPRSHTMRGGYHADTLAAATTSADDVIWYQPKQVEWDMAKRLSGTIMDTTDAIVSAATDAAANGTRHIVIMSNGGFEGIHGKLLAQLPDPT